MSEFDVIVVGAGFAGLRSLYTLREAGLNVVVIEAGSGAGGVWYWNRYPGARCDVESYDYSFGFSEELEQEWRWSERYATQPEILRYVDHVVDRFGLEKHIRFETRMTTARFDETAATWTIETDADERMTARYLIMATGQLSTTKRPEVPGVEDFAGTIYHTGEWPHTPVDFTGRRVGVIGTGSSGVQLIPLVAEQASELTVFQRTPTFTVPASNRPITDSEDADVKAHYAERRARMRKSPSGLGFVPDRRSALEVDPVERRETYEEKYLYTGFGFVLTYYDLLLDEEANRTASDFLREKIAEKVSDPKLAEMLTPRDYPFGTKRPSVDSRYYETFNRENVDLIDLRATPIERIEAGGIRTSAGLVELDDIVFATGFDALTGSLLKPEVIGRGGLTLRDAWAAGPKSYLGVGVAGFPNLFIIAGPGSPSVLANVMLGIEMHVDWISSLIQHARTTGAATIEVTEKAQDDWVAHLNEKAAETLYLKAASWYLGANVPGKPRVFMPYSGGIRAYDRILQNVEDEGYTGFTLAAAVPTA